MYVCMYVRISIRNMLQEQLPTHLPPSSQPHSVEVFRPKYKTVEFIGFGVDVEMGKETTFFEAAMRGS